MLSTIAAFIPLKTVKVLCVVHPPYGLETCTESKTSEKRLNAFEMWSLRRMMRVSWTRRLSNENLIEGMVPGKGGRGRPRNQWCHNVMVWTGMSFAVCKRAAQNRLRWRCIASNPRIGDGA